MSLCMACKSAKPALGLALMCSGAMPAAGGPSECTGTSGRCMAAACWPMLAAGKPSLVARPSLFCTGADLRFARLLLALSCFQMSSTDFFGMLLPQSTPARLPLRSWPASVHHFADQMTGKHPKHERSDFTKLVSDSNRPMRQAVCNLTWPSHPSPVLVMPMTPGLML